MKTLEQRLETARSLRAQGMNCASCVAMAFDDVPGMPDHDTLIALSRGLGGGIGGAQLTCGCLTSMAMVMGMARRSATRPELYGTVRSLTCEFEQSEGATDCHTLKHSLHRDCMSLIEHTITRIHNSLK